MYSHQTPVGIGGIPNWTLILNNGTYASIVKVIPVRDLVRGCPNLEIPLTGY